MPASLEAELLTPDFGDEVGALTEDLGQDLGEGDLLHREGGTYVVANRSVVAVQIDCDCTP